MSREDVSEALKGEDPEPIRRHYVEIEGVEYPIKQVIAKTINIPRISFTSMNAYQILTKLGFKLGEKK